MPLREDQVSLGLDGRYFRNNEARTPYQKTDLGFFPVLKIEDPDDHLKKASQSLCLDCEATFRQMALQDFYNNKNESFEPTRAIVM